MTKLEQLYTIADKYNIKIYFFDLKEIGCLGLNIEKDNMPHMIFLDINIKHDKKLHTEILAHELGHYFTTIGNYVTKPITYSDALNMCKCENKANYWAYDYLVPEHQLVEFINKKVANVYDLAEELEVRVEFLLKRLEYLSHRKQTIDLDNNKYLLLTNLPNLYIFEDLGGHHDN